MKFRIRLLLTCAIAMATIVACSDSGVGGSLKDEPAPAERLDRTMSQADLEAAIVSSGESILQAINVRRAEKGVPALVSQSYFNDLANQRSGDMSVRSYLGHEDPSTGETVLSDLLADGGYAGPAAELVFAARDPLASVPERVAEAWFNDPMHKALLLEPTFRYCGIGLMGDGDWWKITLILAVSVPEEVTS